MTDYTQGYDAGLKDAERLDGLAPSEIMEVLGVNLHQATIRAESDDYELGYIDGLHHEYDKAERS